MDVYVWDCVHGYVCVLCVWLWIGICIWVHICVCATYAATVSRALGILQFVIMP